MLSQYKNICMGLFHIYYGTVYVWSFGRRNMRGLPRLQKRVHWLSERLASLGIMREQFRAPLKPPNTIVLWFTGGIRIAVNWSPMMSRDASFSDSFGVVFTVCMFALWNAYLEEKRRKSSFFICWSQNDQANFAKEKVKLTQLKTSPF